jgi:hypothetical protein
MFDEMYARGETPWALWEKPQMIDFNQEIRRRRSKADVSDSLPVEVPAYVAV